MGSLVVLVAVVVVVRLDPQPANPSVTAASAAYLRMAKRTP
jgi:hypothetical protein